MRSRVVTKFAFVAISLAAIAIVGVLLFGHRTVTTDLAPFSLPESQVRLWVELKPSHPYFAEYDRTLIVTRGKYEARQPLFPDTGGYGRLNIYLQSPEVAVVQGPFEEFLIHINTLQIEKATKPTQAPGNYLAAFAKAPEGVWRFMLAKEAGEVSVGVRQ